MYNICNIMYIIYVYIKIYIYIYIFNVYIYSSIYIAYHFILQRLNPSVFGIWWGWWSEHSVS